MVLKEEEEEEIFANAAICSRPDRGKNERTVTIWVFSRVKEETGSFFLVDLVVFFDGQS